MILGTRGSALALAQSGWVRDRILAGNPGLTLEMTVIRTTGDHQQGADPWNGPQAGSGTGIFVKEIEEALLGRRIDLAVHSLKDLPTGQPEGLLIACTPPREDPRDVIITRGGLSLEALPRGAKVGTGSPRRVAQLRRVRPDLVFQPVRGNVDTRIRRMKEGAFDAVILAAAGLSRLRLVDRDGRMDGAAAVPIPEDVCLPAVGQGALAIEAREGDAEAIQAARGIHDAVCAAEVTAERTFLAGLGGGCRVPVAALARPVSGGRLALRGLVTSPDGSECVLVEDADEIDRARALGERLARSALERGADRLLALPS